MAESISSHPDDELLVRDPVTGVYARAGLESQLRLELERARRLEAPLTLCVMDLDYLKSINDAYGHLRGDGVLRELAHRSQRGLRATDLLFRYGGDEFVLILPGTAKREGIALAQRLLAEIRATPFQGDPPLSISMSVGVATFPSEGETPDALFQRADLRSFEAKRRGRAQVVADDPISSTGLVIEELSRLLERDEALETMHSFLDGLTREPRGILSIIGQPGAGRTRFLNETIKASRLRGFEVVALRGASALRSRPYGALMEADWPAPAAQSEDDYANSLHQWLSTKAQAPLLWAIDNLGDVDALTLDLLRRLLSSPSIPHQGLVYTGEAESFKRLFHLEMPLQMEVEMLPLSRHAMHIWLRVVLRSEPPDDFLDWLRGETDGLPALVQQGLHYLANRAILMPVEGAAWEISPAYPALRLSERLGRRPRAVAESEGPRHNLPAMLTSFLGREAERQQVRRLLEGSRLVTLVGAGGIGKSRLAVQVASDLLDDFAHGAAFVALASVSATEQVGPTIAQVLGIKEVAGQPLMESVKDALRNRELLLILDNFEGVVEAAPLLSDLLAAAPRLRMLVTSREVLHLYGEQEFEVAPLPLLRANQVAQGLDPATVQGQYAAIALFVARAQAVDPRFALSQANLPTVAALCERLEGLPLAIELAAARTKLFPPHVLLARLEDRFNVLTGGARNLPERHQALRSTIDWSYELLQGAERRLLARLAVFRGGSSLEAIEAVVLLPGQDDIPDLIQRLISLVDKSLLRRETLEDGSPRFVMLETIREYAREKLVASGEEVAVRLRHLHFFANLAERAEPALRGAEQVGWIRRLDAEHDNLRAALAWAEREGPTGEPRHDAVQMALRLGGALWRFWGTRGHMSEGRAHVQAVLALPEAGPATLERARALHAAGWLATEQGDAVAAIPCFEESLEIGRLHGDRLIIASALWGLARAEQGQGHMALAFARFGESLELARALGDRWSIARALLGCGWVAAAQGDATAARRFFEEAGALFRRLGDKWGLSGALVQLGIVMQRAGELQAARELLAENLAISQEVGDRRNAAVALERLGQVARLEGKDVEAVHLFNGSLDIWRETGQKGAIARLLLPLGELALRRGDLHTARSFFGESLMLGDELGNGLIRAAALTGLGLQAEAQGQLNLAARLCGAAEALFEHLAIPYGSDAVEAAQQQLQRIASAEWRQAYKQAWDEGRMLSQGALIRLLTQGGARFP